MITSNIQKRGEGDDGPNELLEECGANANGKAEANGRIRTSFCGQNANIDTIHLLQLTAVEPTKPNQAKQAHRFVWLSPMPSPPPSIVGHKTPFSDKISIRSLLLLFILISFVRSLFSLLLRSLSLICFWICIHRTQSKGGSSRNGYHHL